MHFASGAQSYMTSMEDRHGNLIDPDYVTGANGHLSKITDTQGREFDASANANGDITAITDDNITSGGVVDRTWAYAYQTGTRRLASVTDPAGSTTEYGYDGSGRLVTITDPNGTAITIGYDTRLRVTSITRPATTSTADDAITTYDYSSDPTGICADYDGQTLLTDPRGKVAKYCWDERGRIKRSEDADGNRRTKTYTPQRRRDQLHRARGRRGEVL
jgi:YD repeat-containing protein